jgi:hypothetical protein
MLSSSVNFNFGRLLINGMAATSRHRVCQQPIPQPMVLQYYFRIDL